MVFSCPACHGLVTRATALLDRLQPLALLAARLVLARIFFVSGMLKWSDWENTVALFTTEYAVPLLPPALAALSATAFELACPVLLVVGLGARFATLPLLAMTAVINFTYEASLEHYCWAGLLFVILAFGAGAWSLDAVLRRRCATKGAA